MCAVVVALRPDNYAGADEDDDGEGDGDEDESWNVCGEIYHEHPAHRVGEAERAMLEVWRLCRTSSMGTVGHLPEGGGVVDQPAILMEAIRVCDAAAAWCNEFFPRRRPERPARRRRG